MQIDFHHAVTYVVARLAGYDPASAEIVAHSAQYVDDAVNGGTISFRTGQMYTRISSAHKMLDYRNLKELGNHQVWIPFHFLPGNEMLPAGDNPQAPFESKIVCSPDSPVARDMVEACLRDRGKGYGLHRLGITLHVYADTWAHQGFAGINHPINDVDDLDLAQHARHETWKQAIKGYFVELFDDAKGTIVGDAFPLGHGAALTNPDKPFLESWSYIGHDGKRVTRSNTDDFMAAATQLYRVLIDFKDKRSEMTSTANIPEEHFKAILDNFISYDLDDGEKRHDRWIDDIKEGKFGFRDDLEYTAKGRGSWKDRALDTRKEIEAGHERFIYQPYFLRSDWKHFHDALQAHRFDVLHDILPRYNICAA